MVLQHVDDMECTASVQGENKHVCTSDQQRQLFMTHQSLRHLLHSLQTSQPPLPTSTRILIVTACKIQMHSQFALHMQPHLQSVPKLHVCNTTHLHSNNNNSLPNSCILPKNSTNRVQLFLQLSDHSNNSRVPHQQQYKSIIHRPAAERMPTATSCSPHACRVFTWVIISPSSMPVKPSMANLQQQQRRQRVPSVRCAADF